MKKTYQGTPCKRGHSGLRYTANRSCVECSQAADARRFWDPAYQRWRRVQRKARDPGYLAREAARIRKWRATHALRAAKIAADATAKWCNTLSLIYPESMR